MKPPHVCIASVPIFARSCRRYWFKGCRSRHLWTSQRAQSAPSAMAAASSASSDPAPALAEAWRAH
eukprot:772299-Alexandrium_andersonii.AAC.1